MKKIIHVGDTKVGPLFITIEYTDGRLSLCGVEAPLKNGDARGECGQCEHLLNELVTWAHTYDKPMTEKLFKIWERWHLNDMKAGCFHQRNAEWDKKPIDPSKPLNAYGKHFEGQRTDSWNMLTWVTRAEHPQGLLSFPCPVCGYKYGSKWLKESVPDGVIEWLFTLPPGDRVIPTAWTDREQLKF